MKRNLFAALLLLAATAQVIAQNVVTNTTAQTVAYWEIGDIYKAKLTEINEGTKKGVPYKSTSTGSLTIEVIDATDTTYTLEWTFGKWTTTPPVTDKMQLAMAKAFDGVKLKYQTTETGIYKGIINWHEIMTASDSAIKGILPTIADKKLRDSLATIFPRILNQQLYENVFSRYLVSFHNAYGMEYTLKETYGGDVPTPNPWDNNTPIIAEQSITMTSLNKVNRTAHFSFKQEVYDEEAEKFIAAFVETVVKNGSTQVPDFEMKLNMAVEQDFNLTSTWPSQTIFTEVKQIEKAQAQKQIIKIVAVH